MDEGISATGIASASGNLGAPWNFVSQRALPKNTVGTLNPATGEINVLETLSNYGQARTGGHEFSHLIDELSGKISTKGIESPLSQMFSELNTQGYVSKWQKGATPGLYGYKGDDVGRDGGSSRDILMPEGLVDAEYPKTTRLGHQIQDGAVL